MAWCWSVAKPLFEPMLVCCTGTDIYTRHLASMSQTCCHLFPSPSHACPHMPAMMWLYYTPDQAISRWELCDQPSSSAGTPHSRLHPPAPGNMFTNKLMWGTWKSVWIIFLLDLMRADSVPGPWFNIKMISYWYRKSYCRDKMVIKSSSTLGIHLFVRHHLYIESAPSILITISPRFIPAGPIDNWYPLT